MTRLARLDRLAPLPPETTSGPPPVVNGADKARHDAATAFGTPGAVFQGFTLDDPPARTGEEAIARLGRLPVLEYERVRLKEADLIGCRASVLDQLVAQARGDGDATQGRGIILHDPEPWPDPVDLGAVLDETVAALRRHVVLSAAAAEVIALWVAHTYAYERFSHTPRLAITSPLRRCGKSTLLDVLRLICRRTLRADSISASGVFRTVEALKPLVLLIDEADSFLRENEELRGVLNSGYERSGQVIRVVESRGEHRPVAFATFAPVAVAAIGDLPATLADRSIPIRLQRKAVTDRTEKLRHARNREALMDLAREFARWSGDSVASLPLDAAVPDALGDREGDISVPLLAIADAAGGSWSARARHALLEVFAVRTAEEDGQEAAVLLLGDLRAIFGNRDHMASEDICVALRTMEHRPWPEWRNDRPITPPQLARALRPFRVRPGNIRTGERVTKGYTRQALHEAWERYLDRMEA